MSKIIRVAHSFCRKSDNPAELIHALCKRLRLTNSMSVITEAILTTKNGHACRNVDIVRETNVSANVIVDTKHILEYVGVIRRTEEFMVVNWTNIRKIVATPMIEPLVTRGSINKHGLLHQKTTLSAIKGEPVPKRSRNDHRPGYEPKTKPSGTATAAPSFSIESIQAMIKAEVHSQMVAMAQRMTAV